MSDTVEDDATPRVTAWTVLAVFGPLAVALGAGGLTASLGPETAGVWVIPTTLVVAWEAWFVFGRRSLNHAPGASVAASGVGVANAVTLVRGVFVAWVAGFLLTGRLDGAWAWAPALLYAASASLDAVDGALARRLDQQTVLGEKLDMAFDTLGFLVAPLVGVVWGRIPIWYLSLSVARYLFKFGRWQRQRRGRPVFDLPDSRVRRPLAGLQMAFIAVALAPVLPTFVVWVVATVVVVPSLVVFLRDYLVVAGHLSRDDAEGDEGDDANPDLDDSSNDDEDPALADGERDEEAEGDTDDEAAERTDSES